MLDIDWKAIRIVAGAALATLLGVTGVTYLQGVPSAALARSHQGRSARLSSSRKLFSQPRTSPAGGDLELLAGATVRLLTITSVVRNGRTLTRVEVEGGGQQGWLFVDPSEVLPAQPPASPPASQSAPHAAGTVVGTGYGNVGSEYQEYVDPKEAQASLYDEAASCAKVFLALPFEQAARVFLQYTGVALSPPLYEELSEVFPELLGSWVVNPLGTGVNGLAFCAEIERLGNTTETVVSGPPPGPSWVPPPGTTWPLQVPPPSPAPPPVDTVGDQLARLEGALLEIASKADAFSSGPAQESWVLDVKQHLDRDRGLLPEQRLANLQEGLRELTEKYNRLLVERGQGGGSGVPGTPPAQGVSGLATRSMGSSCDATRRRMTQPGASGGGRGGAGCGCGGVPSSTTAREFLRQEGSGPLTAWPQSAGATCGGGPCPACGAIEAPHRGPDDTYSEPLGRGQDPGGDGLPVGFHNLWGRTSITETARPESQPAQGPLPVGFEQLWGPRSLPGLVGRQTFLSRGAPEEGDASLIASGDED